MIACSSLPIFTKTRRYLLSHVASAEVHDGVNSELDKSGASVGTPRISHTNWTAYSLALWTVLSPSQWGSINKVASLAACGKKLEPYAPSTSDPNTADLSRSIFICSGFFSLPSRDACFASDLAPLFWSELRGTSSASLEPPCPS